MLLWAGASHANGGAPVVLVWGADYEIGYKKPPKEHRFSKERQPSLRRRRSPPISQTDVAALLSEPLPVRTGGRIYES